jgi:drug/metabolite transporter (DMT)-like permease
MGETIVALAGTPAGHRLALTLLLVSALAHATFGAINKGGGDPFINRGAINLTYGLIALPVALFVVPWPRPAVWWALAAAFFVHLVYEYLLATAFKMGDFTLVYPIARGMGPLVGLVLAAIVFGEAFTLLQWAGAFTLSAGIFGLAGANIRAKALDAAGLGHLKVAILAALATGVMVAVYTVVDAYGIRLAENPFTFLAWFFVINGIGFPLVALQHWRRAEIKPSFKALAVRGLVGAVVAYISFGSIMIATRLDSVGKAVALRETSIVFAAVIGVLVFRERIDRPRIGLIGLITLGAVMVVG